MSSISATLARSEVTRPRLLQMKSSKATTLMFRRLYGTDLIYEASIILKLPPKTIYFAMMLYHRFSANPKCDPEMYPSFFVAMTTVYLAAKLTDHNRRHRELLTVFDRLDKIRSGDKFLNLLDVTSSRYADWKQTMYSFETTILTEMGFELSIDYPHDFLFLFLDKMGVAPESSLPKKAWKHLMDFARAGIALEYYYQPQVVACGCIWLSAREVDVTLPKQPVWFTVFQVTEEQVKRVAQILQELELKIRRQSFEMFHVGDIDKQLDVIKKTFKSAMSKKRMSDLKRARHLTNSASVLPRHGGTQRPDEEEHPSAGRSPMRAFSESSGSGVPSPSSPGATWREDKHGERGRERTRDFERSNSGVTSRSRSRSRGGGNV